MNKGLRCVFAVVVLFYVLFPQTGFCACPDCVCSNKIPDKSQTECPKAAEAACKDNGCCCRAKSEPKPTASCCSGRSSGEADTGGTSDKCNCSCSDTKLPPPPVQNVTSQVLQEFEYTKDLRSTPLTFPLLPEAFCEFVFLGKTPETPISRLPVRLHLLLLVFLN